MACRSSEDPLIESHSSNQEVDAAEEVAAVAEPPIARPTEGDPGGERHLEDTPASSIGPKPEIEEPVAEVSGVGYLFFAATLEGDPDAAARLRQRRPSSNTELVYAAVANSGLTVEVEMAETNRQASVAPTTRLVDGQTVLVTWSGFLPEQTVNIVQCSQGGREGSSVCDFTHAKILYPNPTGRGSVEMVVFTGQVGNGVCDASVDDCVIAVNDSGLLAPEATIRIPISFADDS